MNFNILIKAGLYSPEWFSFIVHLIGSNRSHVSANAQTSHNLHQNDTSVESLLTSHCIFSLFKRANKSHFCFRLICTNGWKKREMVAAFIKYGNLLNGLWQSHWRSLFRCRWLPPYRLPLSLVGPPVREEKRRKLPPFSTDWQSITITVCLYVRLTDCLSTLPLNPPWLTLFPLHSV